MRTKFLLLLAIFVLANAHVAYSDVNLTIQAQDGNIILSWPSTSSATYWVQYRDSLDVSSTWQTLEGVVQGEDGTTSFTDYNRVPIVSNQSLVAGARNNSIELLSNSEESNEIEDVSTLDLPFSLPPLPPGFPIRSIIEQYQGDEQMSMLTYAPPSVPGITNNIGNTNTGTYEPTMRFYRVLKNGVTILGLTNNISVSGVVSFPVTYTYPEFSPVAFMLNEDNDADEGGAGRMLSDVVTPPASGLPEFVLDTRTMSNGVHTIYASVVLNNGSTVEDGSSTIELDSEPMTINVFNEISFPNWMPSYGELGNSLLISAQSAHQSVDYSVDVYAYYDNYYYVGTFGGHTDDGNIQTTWNLVGPNNESYEDALCCAFVLSTSYSEQGTTRTASAGSPLTYHLSDPWPGFGGWVVANQQAWNRFNGHDNLDTAADGFVRGALALNLPILPQYSSNNRTSYRLEMAAAVGVPAETGIWTTFRNAIYAQQSRNLFYLGHGSATGIGANLGNTNAFIPATEIAARLHTIPAGQTNRHGYRFVFFDGCSTAKGQLCEAFGIIHKENIPIEDYTSSSTRPSVYLGWNTDIAIAVAGSILSDHWNFIQYFQQQWALGDGVKEAINNASHRPGVSIHRKALKIFGYSDLHVNEFNR